MKVETSSSKERKSVSRREKSPARVSLLEAGVDSEKSSDNGGLAGNSTGFASTWQSMKMGFQNFKVNVGNRKFLPLNNGPQDAQNYVSSSASLDEIFQKLKRRPTPPREVHLDDDDEDEDDFDDHDHVYDDERIARGRR